MSRPALNPNRLDVVVRFHDPERAFELKRSILSLVCQSYRPLGIHLVTQRFAHDQVLGVTETIRPLLSIDSAVEFKLWNYTQPQPEDARSALLNTGIENSKGRYLAFLDHDDAIYPDAYMQLISELDQSESAVSFGTIVLKEIDVFHDTLMVMQRRLGFSGRNLVDFFNMNFCPLHSFVLDRSRIERSDLWMDPRLSKHEDYDFLLRICAKYKASFGRIDTEVGDYYLKNDGSNTISVASNESRDRFIDWQIAEELIEKRRRSVVLSPEIQHTLGFSPANPNMTIRDAISYFENHPEPVRQS